MMDLLLWTSLLRFLLMIKSWPFPSLPTIVWWLLHEIQHYSSLIQLTAQILISILMAYADVPKIQHFRINSYVSVIKILTQTLAIELVHVIWKTMYLTNKLLPVFVLHLLSCLTLIVFAMMDTLKIKHVTSVPFYARMDVWGLSLTVLHSLHTFMSLLGGLLSWW